MGDLLRRLCCADRRQNEAHPPAGITYINEAFQIEVQNRVYPPSFDDEEDDVTKAPITDENDVVLEPEPETRPDSRAGINEVTISSETGEVENGPTGGLQHEAPTDQVLCRSEQGTLYTSQNCPAEKASLEDIPEEDAPPVEVPADPGDPPELNPVVVVPVSGSKEGSLVPPTPNEGNAKTTKNNKYNDENCEQCVTGDCDGSPEHTPIGTTDLVTCAQECGVSLPDTEERVDEDNNIVGCDDCYINDNVCNCSDGEDACDVSNFLLGSFLPFAQDNISIGYDAYETVRPSPPCEQNSDPPAPSNGDEVAQNADEVSEGCSMSIVETVCSICANQGEGCTTCPGCSSAEVDLVKESSKNDELLDKKAENPVDGLCDETSSGTSKVDHQQSNELFESKEYLERQSLYHTLDDESTTEDNCSSLEIICEAVIEPIPAGDVETKSIPDITVEEESLCNGNNDSSDILQDQDGPTNQASSETCSENPLPKDMDNVSEVVTDDCISCHGDTTDVDDEKPEPAIKSEPREDVLSHADSPCEKNDLREETVANDGDRYPDVCQDACKSFYHQPPGGSQNNYTLSGPNLSGSPDSTAPDGPGPSCSDLTCASQTTPPPMTNVLDDHPRDPIGNHPHCPETLDQDQVHCRELSDSSPSLGLSVRFRNIIDRYSESESWDQGSLDPIIDDICNGEEEASIAEFILFLIKTGYQNHVKRILDCKKIEKCFGISWGEPLSVAIRHNHPQIIELLASSSGRWEYLYKFGSSPLHLAVHLAQGGCVAVLLKYAKAAGCIDEVSLCVETGETVKQTALQIASAAGNLNLVLLLLGQGADANLPVREDGRTAIWLAAAAGHDGVVRVLLQAGADLEVKDCDEDGQTLLHFYTGQRNHLMVNELLAKGVSVDATDATNNQTALHVATTKGDYMIVESLVKHGACATVKDRHGKSPLVLSIEECNATIVELLLPLLPPNEALDDDGNTPLHLAIQYGHRPTIEYIMGSVRWDVNYGNVYGKTALHLCGQQGLSDVAANILSSCAIDVDMVDVAGRSALHDAATRGHLTLVAQLVQAGFDSTLQDHQGVSPIVACGLCRIVDVLQYLIATSRHSLPLYQLATMATVNDVMFLKSHGVDFDKQDINGRVPIWHAVNQADMSTTEVLLKVQARVNLPDNCGNTPLHVASQKGLLDIADRLLDSGALMTVPNLHKDTPLAIAMEKKHKAIVKVLLEHGAFPDTKLQDGRTCVFTAIENNDLSMVRLLLEYSAHVNYTCSGTMEQPIHLAAKLGHVDIVKTLVEFGAEVNAMEFLSRKTPLHLACQYGHHDTVLQLLLSRADISMETILGEKPLLLAAREGRFAVVDSLLKAGAEVNLLDDDHCVIYDMAKHVRVWDLLTSWAERNPRMLEPPSQLSSRLHDLCSRVNNLIQGLPIEDLNPEGDGEEDDGLVLGRP